MSTATKKREKQIEGFDEAKLAELVEPIRVTVHKVTNGRKQPIILPTKPGESGAGIGYTIDDVRQLNEFLPNEWSGGGLYDCTATGENGAQMRWEAYFPLDKYPEQIPPTMVPAASPAAMAASGVPAMTPISMIPASPPMGVPMSAQQSSFLSQAAATYPPQQQAPQGQGQPFQPYPSSNYQGGGLNGSGSQVSADVQREREERIKLEAKIERERLETQYKERFSGLEQEFRRMQDNMSTKRSAPSDEVQMLKAELDRERAAREQDKLAGSISTMQQQFQQQLLEMQRQNQEALREMQRNTERMFEKLNERPSGPDPMLLMMMESQKQQTQAQLEQARASADAQKEIARMQTEAQREASRNAIGPREMVELMSKTNVGHEQVMTAMGRAWELMQTGVETILQSQGPGVHPALAMLGEGVQGGLQLAQRYMDMKQQTQTTQARAAVAIAQTRQAQLSGATIPAGMTGAAPAQAAQVQNPAPEPEGNEGEDEEGEGDAAAAEKAAEIQRTEEELFGPALESVRRMREGAASGALSPHDAAMSLLQGIDQVIKLKVRVPAFDLWQKQEWPQLVNILLPDSKMSFREQMLQALFDRVNELKAAQEGGK